MLLKITGDCNELKNGIIILSEVLGFEISDQGICVEVTKNKDDVDDHEWRFQRIVSARAY